MVLHVQRERHTNLIRNRLLLIWCRMGNGYGSQANEIAKIHSRFWLKCTKNMKAEEEYCALGNINTDSDVFLSPKSMFHLNCCEAKNCVCVCV